MSTYRNILTGHDQISSEYGLIPVGDAEDRFIESFEGAKAHFAFPYILRCTFENQQRRVRAFKMSLEEKFQAAAGIIQKLPKTGPFIPTDDQKLNFYSLYKQATVGKNNKPEPGLLNIVEKAKWNAWKKLGDMPPDEAKAKYIAAVKEVMENVSKKLNVVEWLEKIDPELPKKFTLVSGS